MSYSNSWKDICKKRVLISRILSLGLMFILSLGTLLFLFMYNYSLYIIIPFMLCYFTLGYLGMTYFVGMWFGLYAALLPIEKDHYNPIHQAKDLAPDARIAVIVPVYHEDIRRVSAAIAAMVEDLEMHAERKHFDFLILSDSRKIDVVSQEMFAAEKLKDMYPETNFIYRHRIYNGEAKLGNISDFIKRFSPNYKFMMMLDADSIVPGKSMIDMARIMEGSERIGIVQANLSMVMRNTLYARISKFISSFSLTIGFFGQYYFYMGKSYYYGHNAMIRTAAFAEHCALPILKKKGPWSAGRPLSHDYVEAALLDGAGYEIWSLPQIPSFEELPTNFIDDFQRENRWMYGSMTYLRVFLLDRLDFLYKTRLFTSAINYFNPLFGWLFLIMGLYGLVYIFDHPMKSYYLMKKFEPILLFSLFFLVFSIFAKGGVSVLYFYKKKELYLYGGISKIIISYFAYVIYNMLVAPMYMCQLSKMLLFWVSGRKIQWGEQNREDRGLTWGEAISQVGWMSVIGVFITYIVIYNVFSHDTLAVQKILHISKFSLMFWYFPLLGGLLIAPIIVRLTSQENSAIKSMSWFKSPQEVETHFVIRRTEELIPYFSEVVPENLTFLDLIASPWFFFRRLRQLPHRQRKYHFWKDTLLSKKVEDLTVQEKFLVLRNRHLWEDFHIRGY